MISKSTVDLNTKLKSELQQLKGRYQNLIESIAERVNRLEKLINELKQYEEDYIRMLSSLNKIENQAQIEHYAHGSNNGKSVEAQLDTLKQIKYELDSLHPSMRKLNEQSEKYLYEMNKVNILSAANTENKFQLKLKDDIITLNEKFKQLNKNYIKTLANLEVSSKTYH